MQIKAILEKLGMIFGIKIAETVIVPVSATEPDHSPKHTIQSTFALLAYSKHAYLRKLVDQLIEGKLVYKTLYETDNATKKELVLQGLGVAWIPKLMLKKILQPEISHFTNKNIALLKIFISSKII